MPIQNLGKLYYWLHVDWRLLQILSPKLQARFENQQSKIAQQNALILQLCAAAKNDDPTTFDAPAYIQTNRLKLITTYNLLILIPPIGKND